MASANASFDDREWQVFFKQFSKGFDWATILRTAFSVVGFADIAQHFKDEKGEDAAWKKRSPETQKQYTKIFNGEWRTPRGATRAQFNPSNKMLQMTGKLRGSILPANIKKVSPTSIMVFSNVDYSGVHDQGGKHMPKREFMWLSSNAKSLMLQNIMHMAIKD